MGVPASLQTAVPAFEGLVESSGPRFLCTKNRLSVMQVNVGRLCNLACKHCHVEAGPDRTEIMDRSVMEACLAVLRENDFDTLDITGGSPEMNPHFRWLLPEARKVCGHVLVRTNLVILLEPGYEDLPGFFRENGAEVVCSLPHYTPKNTDRMRGDRVFERSIQALKMLNALGYGKEESLPLRLVFNPAGAFLPADQAALERDFRARLKNDHNLEFTSLLAITNNPVGRFGAFLECSGNMMRYMEMLYSAFNASTLEAMMCRSQISVAYDGGLYDCDFNQAAGLPVQNEETIFDWLHKPVEARRIRFGNHCYACTAGQGSSCGGAVEG